MQELIISDLPFMVIYRVGKEADELFCVFVQCEVSTETGFRQNVAETFVFGNARDVWFRSGSEVALYLVREGTLWPVPYGERCVLSHATPCHVLYSRHASP